MSRALEDVFKERIRQITEEGWTPDHDDKHVGGEIAVAAACYAINAAAHEDVPGWPEDWPWSPDWWKPTDRRRDLVKAGALILAEIERLDRASGEAEP